MLLPELEADGAAEIDELRLAEAAWSRAPKPIGRTVRVVGDGVRPFERGALGTAEAGEVHRLGVVPR